ncbi:MAG: rhamnogalacturonan acetylesterase [Bacteroidota bacterium]|nr:rhamnogalacturonan acetylesterase [Bacteroidota bacterium]
MKWTWLAGGCLMMALLSFTVSQKKIRLFIAGDSTAQGYDTTKTLQRGWGQYLASYFNDNVRVVNLAKAGRSSGSYLNEGRWDSLICQVRKGDYVLIQFGHNDTSTNPERHVVPDQYQKNLMRFCEEVRAKKAHPVIVTSIVMREFENGQLIAKRPHFAEYVELARIAAKAAGVPLIDLNRQTTELVRSMGDEASKTLYFWVKPGEGPNPDESKQDDTHLRQKGAVIYAGFVAQSIREQHIKPLAGYLR